AVGEFEGDEGLVALGVNDVGEFVGGEVDDAAFGGAGDDDAVFNTGEDDVALHGGVGGDDEEAVVFAGVGAGDGAGGVTAEAVGEEPFCVDGGVEVAAGGGVEGNGHGG